MPLLTKILDLILVPLGIWILLQLVPDEIMQDARARAAEYEDGTNTRLPRNYLAGAMVVLLWVAGAVWLLYIIKKNFFS